jgi:molybdopterin synthase catalytic subunit
MQTSVPPPGIYTKGSLDITPIAAALGSDAGTTGSVVSFTGFVKRFSKYGRKVSYLVMESYDPLASEQITKICSELSLKYQLNRAAIYHFVGKFFPGEVLVHIVIASTGRKEGLTALEEAIHRYKTEPAIWKQEVYEDGTSTWIEGES